MKHVGTCLLVAFGFALFTGDAEACHRRGRSAACCPAPVTYYAPSSSPCCGSSGYGSCLGYNSGCPSDAPCAEVINGRTYCTNCCVVYGSGGTGSYGSSGTATSGHRFAPPMRHFYCINVSGYPGQDGQKVYNTYQDALNGRAYYAESGPSGVSVTGPYDCYFP